MPACTTASDCAAGPLVAPADEDNLACEDGRCEYRGCNCDAECTEFFQIFGDFAGVCRQVSQSVPQCFLACQEVEDCGDPTDPEVIVDHFTCEQGACLPQGCANTTECSAVALLEVCVGP
ncbi:MAG: hypothetical protein IT382_04160 [Deltaproteobacteria bacterium]|nr:hypothetical protein [Deltaproteobacteria bacterium]